MKTDKREKGATLVGPRVLLGQPEMTSSLNIKTIMVLTMPAAGMCSQAPPGDDDGSSARPRPGEGTPGACGPAHSLFPLRGHREWFLLLARPSGSARLRIARQGDAVRAADQREAGRHVPLLPPALPTP